MSKLFFSCKLDQGNWQNCNSPVNCSDLNAGEHIFKVYAADLAGNVETEPVEYGWAIDLTIPSTPIILWPNQFPYYASSRPVVINGTNNSGLIVSINNPAEAEIVEMINDTSWQSSFDLIEGENVFYIKSVDQFGAESGQDDFTIVLDISAPVITIVSCPDSFASSTAAEFEFSADEENVIYQCRIDGGDWNVCEASPIGYEESSNRASTTISNLTEDEHNLEAKAIDQAGNISNALSYGWLVDLTAPTSTIETLAGEFSETGFTVNWSGSDASSTVETSGLANFDAQYKINSADWQNWISATTSASAVFSINVSAGDNIYFRVRACDNAGNVNENWSEPVKTSIVNNQADHVVISEVQIAGATATDEFVELFNPTDNTINLDSYRLSRKTSSGNKSNLLTNFPDVNLSAHSYYLITHPSGYDGEVTTDAVYSTSESIAANNTIILYSDGGQTVVDKVGLGIAIDFEGIAYPDNPLTNQSIERKAAATSTAETMVSGGTHQYLGNGYDSDDNSSDFVIRDSPDPQNSSSPTEPRDSAPIVPDSITDLIVQNIYTTANSVKLFWTSPANANISSGAYYDLRYKAKDGDCDLHLTWHNAAQVSISNLPTPTDIAEQDQSAEISGLTAGAEYCFAIKTFNGENWSGLSNQVSEVTLFDVVNSITVDSVSSSTPCIPCSYEQTIVWPHTVSGNDAVLLVQIFWRPTYTTNYVISSVTYNGAPLSLAVSKGNPHKGIYSAIYYLVNPSHDEHNIIVSFPLKNVFSAASAISLNNCDTTTDDPIDSIYSEYAGDAHIKGTITTISANTMLVDAVANERDIFVLTADAGQIDFFGQMIADYHLVGRILSGAASYKPVSGSGDHQMSWTKSDRSVYIHLIAAIKAKP